MELVVHEILKSVGGGGGGNPVSTGVKNRYSKGLSKQKSLM